MKTYGLLDLLGRREAEPGVLICKGKLKSDATVLLRNFSCVQCQVESAKHVSQHDLLAVNYLLARVDLEVVGIALHLVTQLLLILLNLLLNLINRFIKFLDQL